MKLDLEMRRMEIDKEVRIRQLELDAGSSATPQPAHHQAHFDLSKNIALVPPFRESEVDSYIFVFERVAAALHWPLEIWPLLLQC